MPENYLEPFVTLPEGTAFRAAVLHTACEKVGPEALPSVRVRAVLVHTGPILLAPAQLIRRESDGAVFTVIGDDAIDRTPACATFTLAQVEVERVVYTEC